MNHILAVPNWSIHHPELINSTRKAITNLGCKFHYAKGDPDHHRTVIAFSGPQDNVFKGMDLLTELILPEIDLSEYHGVHPASGALDVAPFVLLQGDNNQLIEANRTWAKSFFQKFQIPVHLYEQSAFPGDEYRLPALRGQIKSIIPPYFAGSISHPHWGQTITGVRNFLLAANINLSTHNLIECKKIAQSIRSKRENDVDGFKGVRALAFQLPSLSLIQISFNLTNPDESSFDELYEVVSSFDLPIHSTELIGVIRSKDLPNSSHLKIHPDQIVN